ncbi:MAG: TrbI/VirB10 family protein, partial [Caulobacteraceae bacterium]
MSKQDPLDPAVAVPGRGKRDPSAFSSGVRRLNSNILWIGGICVLIVVVLVGQGLLKKMGRKPSVAPVAGAGKDPEDATAQANKLIASAGPQPGVTPSADVGAAPSAQLPGGASSSTTTPVKLTPQEQQAIQQQEQARQAVVEHENAISRARETQFSQALSAPGGVRFTIPHSASAGGSSTGSPGVRAAAPAVRAASDTSGSAGAAGGASSSSALDRLKRQLTTQAEAGLAPTQAQSAELTRLIQDQAADSGGQNGGVRGGLANKTNAYDQFNGDRNRGVSLGKVEAPISPFELRAGFVIPGIMITGINSEIPGQIAATVSQNVFDTATGRFLLIPQGSRLIGSYGSDAGYGQTRVLVAWQRIVFPNGNALDIGSMPGADSAGYSGFHDKVNNHYLRIFGSALMLSAINGLVYLGSQQNNQLGTTTNAQTAFSQSLGQELGETSNELI